MTQFEFKDVANAALNSIDAVLERWVPGGSYQGAEYVALNPTRSDGSKGSFSVNRNSGAWADFADNTAKGGDLVALVAYIERVNQGKACKMLAEFLGMQPNSLPHSPPRQRSEPKPKKEQWLPISPAPESALKNRPLSHYRNGKPTQEWIYLDSNSRFLMAVMRFDIDKKGERKKDYRPLVYCQNSITNKLEWRWQQPTENRPLYGLHKLANSPEATVLLTEGEKACDAAEKLFPQWITMSWPGGAEAIKKADFSPLSGKKVVIWPDNDAAGKKCASQLKSLLKKFGCNVEEINLTCFGEVWPEKADAADAEANGINQEKITVLLAAGDLIKNEKPTQSNTEKSQVIGQFLLSKKGLYFRGNEDNDQLIRICDPLYLVAHTRDKLGKNWGLLVRFSDLDHAEKEWNIPSELLATEGGAEVLRQLFNLGLRAEAGQQPRRRLIQYLMSSTTDKRYTLVNKLGWHDEAYLLPNATKGTPKEPLYYYSDLPNLNKTKVKGDLNQWRESIAAYCRGNPLLTFAISAAFAAPLFHLIGEETTGFHFVGDSSLGKSTLLKAAGSVYGGDDYKYSWRTTDNALEAIAAAHNDSLLVLDEIGECDPRIVGEIVYMLANQRGKSRANEKGGSLTWRLLFLSSGEKTLSEQMAEAGKRVKAGQEIRLISIPANAGSGYGIFNELHGFIGGKALSEHLTSSVNKHHGSAIEEFLNQLCISDLSKIAKRILLERNNFSATLSDDASGQVRRAANKFVLVGFAGELATRAGITGWQMGEAKAAAEECFKRWLNARGGVGSLEDQQILEQIKLFFNRHGEGKFTRWDSDNSTVDKHGVRTMGRCGFRKDYQDANALDDAQCEYATGNQCSEAIYFVSPESFKAEICEGINVKRAKELLAECGALERDTEGKYSKPVRLPDSGRSRQRVHVIKPHLILHENDSSDMDIEAA